MRQRTLLSLLVVAVGACGATRTPDPVPTTGIAADVAYLASPALGGRAAGSDGDDSAAMFIARRYQGLGLNGAFRSACGADPACAAAYFQFFTVDGLRDQNVGAIVPGFDSTCNKEYVVVGAHYDHLGYSPLHSRDPQLGSALRPGADDNASGTAALLELGRRLAQRPPPCSVLLINFDAEELGMIGSAVFVDHLPVTRSSLMLMVNLDMVGRLRSGGLTIDESALKRTESRTLRVILDSAAATAGLHARYSSDTQGRSDHASFGRIGVPAIEMFTGFHSDYHRTTDVASRVDAAGIERIVDVTEALVRASPHELSSIDRRR